MDLRQIATPKLGKYISNPYQWCTICVFNHEKNLPYLHIWYWEKEELYETFDNTWCVTILLVYLFVKSLQLISYYNWRILTYNP